MTKRRIARSSRRTVNIHWAETVWHEPFLAVSVRAIRQAHRRLLVKQIVVVVAVVVATQAGGWVMMQAHRPVVVLVSDAEALASSMEPTSSSTLPIAVVTPKPVRAVTVTQHPVRTVVTTSEKEVPRPRSIFFPTTPVSSDDPVDIAKAARGKAKSGVAMAAAAPSTTPPTATGTAKPTVFAPADKLGIQALHTSEVEMEGGSRVKVGATFPGGEVIERIDVVKGLVETNRRVLVVTPEGSVATPQ